MEAIKKLEKVGFTRQQIAEGLPGKTGVPMLRLYERGMRFPGRRHYVCFVEMAESRGLLLVASDFIEPNDDCAGDT